MPMVDKNLILRKLTELEEYLHQVSEYSTISVEEYTESWKTQRIVERTLQIMIELCIDIAGHIISDKKLRMPVSYADTFRVLFECRLIAPETYSVMEKMAKFRNIVIHQYEKIDAVIVVMILQKHLSDFLTFRDELLAILGDDAKR